MGKKLSAEAQIWEDEAKERQKEETLRRLNEVLGQDVHIWKGPGIRDLILALLSPTLENGEPRTFDFGFVAEEEIYLPCQIKDVMNIDRINGDCSLRLVCYFDEKTTHVFHVSYRFSDRRGVAKNFGK